MNDHEISTLLLSDPCTKKFFRGVYSRDNLPNVSGKENYYVVNLSLTHEEGTHWIAIYKSTYKTEYYDSFGFPPLHEEIKIFLGDNFTYNDVQIQHPFSVVCGQHTIFYIVQRCKGVSLLKIQKLFKNSNEYLLHDVLINLSVERYFNVDLEVMDFKWLLQELKEVDIDKLPIDKKGKLLVDKSIPMISYLPKIVERIKKQRVHSCTM